MPETNLKAISHLISGIAKELPQRLLIFFHKPTPYVPRGLLEHHPPHELPNLESTKTLSYAPSAIAIS